jgi:multiple antibiotic resistance protein
MQTLFDFGLISFVSLFVIVDPIGLIPPFLAMTGRHAPADRIRIARTASVVACGILIFFLILGGWLINTMELKLSSFQIAGGIVLMIIGLDMLQARPNEVKASKAEETEAIDKDDIAITPMAMPMLAGPGSITAVLLFGHRAKTPVYTLTLAAAIVGVCLASYLTLHYAAVHSAKLSQITLKIITRLMGLFLTVISVQFIMTGLREATHLW